MNIEKFKALEKIKLSYLKHSGNCLEIADELSLPLDYVKKMVKKFKGQEDRAVSVLIANNLMSHVLLGSQSRTTHLMDMLRSLEATEKPPVSTCCNAPVKEVIQQTSNTISDEYNQTENTSKPIKQWRCMKCQAICDVHTPPKSTIYNIKMKLLENLRAEDVSLVEMAESMGYTNKVDVPTTVIHNKPNVLVMNNVDNGTDKKIVEEISNLSLMDKERLIEKLRREIVKLDTEDVEEGEISNE